MDKTRIDSWVYSVRLFKTRAIASAAIGKGKVKLNEIGIKASHPVKVGDIVYIRDSSLFRKFKILALARKRMSAKLVNEYYEEITSPADLERLMEIQQAKRSFIHFGQSRPTKKDRRNINKFLDS